MGLPIFHSQYTAAQIEASIGKTPRIKAATRTWEIWDIATSKYVDTGVSIDTELFVDNTLTEAGYAADAKVTGDKVSELKSAIKCLSDGGVVCEKGSIDSSDGTDINSNFRVRTVGYYLVSKGDFVTLSSFADYEFGVFEYDTSKAFKSYTGFITYGHTVTRDGYVRVIAKPQGPNVQITDTHISEVQNLLNIYNSMSVIGEEIESINSAMSALGRTLDGFDYGTLSNGVWQSSTTRAVCDYFYAAKGSYIINTNSVYNLSVSAFSGMSESAFISVSGWIPSNKYTATADGYLRCVVKRNDNAALTSSDIAEINKIVMMYGNDNQAIGTDYIVGADFSKKYITLKQMKRLTNFQAFCFYDDKIISVKEGYISSQNMDFSAIETKSASFGHANNLQRGSGSNAYVSGWNDNKVYIVDLDTLTVTGSIDLPVSGYTTCVVDDDNTVVYIFSRTSDPSTEDVYVFTAYNYTTEQVLYTFPIRKFGAMQACDFCNGRIIVSNGMGTSAVKNGLYVYSTHGDVLANYELSSMSGIEPEGVYVDRDTHEVYLSYVNYYVYKVIEL